MDPLSFLTIMAGVTWVNNVYDYVVFTRKHRETQEEIKNLRGEVSSINRNLVYMTNEIRENNKIIKNLENTIKETKA